MPASQARMRRFWFYPAAGKTDRCTDVTGGCWAGCDGVKYADARRTSPLCGMVPHTCRTARLLSSAGWHRMHAAQYGFSPLRGWRRIHAARRASPLCGMVSHACRTARLLPSAGWHRMHAAQYGFSPAGWRRMHAAQYGFSPLRDDAACMSQKGTRDFPRRVLGYAARGIGAKAAGIDIFKLSAIIKQRKFHRDDRLKNRADACPEPFPALRGTVSETVGRRNLKETGSAL